MDKKRLNIRYDILVMLFLVITTAAVYLQVKDHNFVNLDDKIYIYENVHVQAGLTFENVAWAFTTYETGNWHPLTWLSHMLDVQLFGLKPGAHHVMNLLFHIVNTLLLFLVLHRMTKSIWKCAFVAAIFALHPLHVESVAWASERKDVFSTFFWLLTMGAYVYYVERPTPKRYLLALLFFTLGLMAKPMLVTLPFVLLLLDYWPLGRLQLEKLAAYDQQKSENTKPTEKRPVILQMVLEKVPFFILSAASSIVTIVAQQKGGAIASLERLPLLNRVANALISYCTYIWKMIWSANLAVLYPHPVALSQWQAVGAGLFLLTSSLLIIRTVRHFPYLTVGWLWYLGTLVPSIGLVQVGIQAMADRYTYVPLTGLSIMIAWGVPDLLKKWRYQRVVLGILSLYILSLLTAGTWMQVHFWQNSTILYTHTLDVTSNNYLVHNNFGTSLQDEGNLSEAIHHYSEALRIEPNYEDAHNNLGTALYAQGRIQEAILHYTDTLRIKPNHAAAHNNLGTALQKQGYFTEAANHYVEAIRLRPDYAKSYANMGGMLTEQGKYDEAKEYYLNALRIDPDFVEIHYNLGTILFSQRNTDEAIAHFREAVRLKPNHARAYNNLGNALLLKGKFGEAVDNFQQALRLKPDFKLAEENLATALILQKNAR